MDNSTALVSRRTTPVLGAVITVVLAALVGCGARTQNEVEPAAPASSAAQDGGGSDAGGNSDEGPSPDNGGGGGPSIKLASLPVGGNAEDLQDANHQCATVNYAGSGDADLTDGIEVAFENATPSSPTFVVLGGSCDDSVPSCWGYVFTSSQRTCTVAVEARNVGPDDLGQEVTLTVSGQLVCHTSASRCASFANAAAQPTDTSVTLNTPESTD
jgi:hypothetical protein